MSAIPLGAYVRQCRNNKGLTQKQLCEGICEPSTLSRLENGKQTPNHTSIEALLQRLGVPSDRYFVLLSENEEEIVALKDKIISCNSLHQNAKGLAYVNKLEKLIESDDYITQQFILRSKAILGKPDGTAYTYSEKLEMLLQAIRLTIPQFDLKCMQKFLYSIDEIKILNHIAIIYTRIGEHKKATDIYSRLLKYTKKHYNNPQKSEGLFLLISYNYAHELCNLKRYEEAIQVGEAGVHMATQYGHCMVLPATLSVLAESYYFLGHKEKSRILYTQSYAIATVLGNDCDCKDIKEDAKKYLNIEFDY